MFLSSPVSNSLHVVFVCHILYNDCCAGKEVSSFFLSKKRSFSLSLRKFWYCLPLVSQSNPTLTVDEWLGLTMNTILAANNIDVDGIVSFVDCAVNNKDLAELNLSGVLEFWVVYFFSICLCP